MNAVQVVTILLLILIPQFINSVPCIAQDEARTREIAVVLWRGVTEAEKGFMEYFKQQHRPVHFTLYQTEQSREKLLEIIPDLHSAKTDLIYCFGTTAALTLAGRHDHPEEHLVNNIPIVFCIVSAPLQSGIINDLQLPGRNITGVTHLVPFPDQLKAMKQVFKFKRCGFIYNPLEENSIVARDFFRAAAVRDNFQLLEAPFKLLNGSAPDPGSIAEVINPLVADAPDFIYLPSDSFVVSKRSEITALLKEKKIPTFSATEVPIRNGDALTGLVCQYYSCGLFAAYKAEQILFENIPPGKIPVEPLKRYSFLVNMATALSIDYFPPITVLQFAEIINTENEGN